MAACKDGVFDEHMIFALKRLRPELVRNVNNVEDILDHMHFVFPSVSHIRAEKVPEERVRKLLDGLERRPAKDFWVFIKVLFKSEIRQGHLAEELLGKFEMHGGTIPPKIQRLLESYQYHERLDNPLYPMQESQPLTSAQPEFSPPTAPSHLETSDGGSIPSWHLNSFRPGVPDSQGLASMGAESAGIQQNNAERRGSSQASAVGMETDSCSAYQHHKDSGGTPGVYRMESVPRGEILIINNIDFDHFLERTDAEQDCTALAELFENLLGFLVTVRVNLKGQAMREEIERFSLEMSGRQDLDSCSVAIMTHGCAGDVLFGTDGCLTPQGAPQPDTYILGNDLRHIFSSSQCPGMREKPKLFIIQACRGNLVDTRAGLSSLGRSVNVQENFSRNQADVAHYAFIYATVEDYVAYRHLFIRLLVDVFKTYAHTHHLLDLATTLNGRMLNEVVNNHMFTISEQRITTSCRWFLNPPHTS